MILFNAKLYYTDLFLVKTLKTNYIQNDKILVNSGISYLYKMYP